jgi:hypothetical protein
MGIRFHCPNGHKLNVKSFLAGKKGVCPDCGVKMRIPERSEPGLDSGIDEEKQEAPQQQPGKPDTEVKLAAAAAPTAGPVPTQPAPMPATAAHAVARPASGVALPVMPAGGYPAVTAAPPMPVAAAGASPPYGTPAAAVPGRGPLPTPPPVPPPAPPGTVDAIAENPLATWFVRPPSGGQFGPARGEVMRKWLTEGRVTADSLVWREGWIDWLTATEVFPQLSKNAQSPFGLTTASVRPAGSSLPARKPSRNNTGMLILVALILLCLLLVGVLAVVLSGGLSST